MICLKKFKLIYTPKYVEKRRRGRPKKIAMQQNEEIEDHDVDCLSDIDEVTRALESTRIHNNGLSFNSIFETQKEETILDDFYTSNLSTNVQFFCQYWW